MWTRAIAGATPHEPPIAPHAPARPRRIASARTAGSALLSGTGPGVAAVMTCPPTVARLRFDRARHSAWCPWLALGPVGHCVPLGLVSAARHSARWVMACTPYIKMAVEGPIRVETRG